jgi:hypothetical protein
LATKSSSPGPRQVVIEDVMETGVSRGTLAYALAYETSERIFGATLPAHELIERVRAYDWRESLIRLADLASIASHARAPGNSERIRKRTIDPLTALTGSNETLLRNARVAVSQRRDQMVLAHEESILFLQHLVILEGATEGPAPGDPEIALWLAGANSHLEQSWADESSKASAAEGLTADMVRLSRYNNNPDLLRALVRANTIFGTPPINTKLAEPAAWWRMQEVAFGKPFERFFDTGPALLAVMTQGWGSESQEFRLPTFGMQWLSSSALPANEILDSLQWMTGTRESIATETRKRLRANGLPHCPTALLHTPIVDLGGGFVAATPGALVNQLRTGIWARCLAAAKSGDVGVDVDEWNSAFGYMVEGWCRRVARAARESSACIARVVLPSQPGAPDEVEDVVVVEGHNAVLFSVKSRLVDTRASREGRSPETTLSWLDEFFFAEKTKRHRAGAVSLLSKRIDMLRSGAFEAQGVARDVRVFPIVVTYDCLGENELLYRRLEEGCRRRALLQQEDVGPLTIARLEDFEELMVRVSVGKAVSGLLTNRERGDRNRRLDQIIYEINGPGVADRLAFFDDEFWRLCRRMQALLSGTSAST